MDGGDGYHTLHPIMSTLTTVIALATGGKTGRPAQPCCDAAYHPRRHRRNIDILPPAGGVSHVASLPLAARGDGRGL